MNAANPSSANHSIDFDNADITQSVYEELIAWSVRLNSGRASAEDIQLFERWRAQDIRHEAAWQKLHTVELSLSALPNESKQVAIETLQLVDKQQSLPANRSRALKLLGFVAIVITSAALIANMYAPWQQEFHYATNIGKRENILLTDGTRLMLNTNSKVDVKLSLLKREIILHRGEIYIETGKDIDSVIGRRSFWVNTQQAKLEAIGTRFSVNQQTSATQLHMVEGIVDMHVGHGVPVPAYANETYTMPDAVSTPIKMNATDGMRMDPMAWVDGMLVVKQMRLDEFVAELSRYQDFPLVCAPSASSLIVSGVFQLNRADPVEHALKAITRTLPLRILKQDNIILISKK